VVWRYQIEAIQQTIKMASSQPGRAYFVNSSDVGHLKAWGGSFFGHFMVGLCDLWLIKKTTAIRHGVQAA